MSLYGQLSVIKQHQFYTYIGHASCTLPNKRVCLVSDQKHTVFRVVIKITEKLIISGRTNI